MLEDRDNAVPQSTTWRVELSEKEKNIVSLVKDPVKKEKIIEILDKKNDLMAATNYDKWCFDLDSLSLQGNSYLNTVLNKLDLSRPL